MANTAECCTALSLFLYCIFCIRLSDNQKVNTVLWLSTVYLLFYCIGLSLVCLHKGSTVLVCRLRRLTGTFLRMFKSTDWDIPSNDTACATTEVPCHSRCCMYRSTPTRAPRFLVTAGAVCIDPPLLESRGSVSQQVLYV